MTTDYPSEEPDAQKCARPVLERGRERRRSRLPYQIGDKFWERIDASIRLHDKLLVVLSEQSIASDWVEHEVMSALEKEGQSPERTVLFLVRLDDAVKTARHPWAADLRRRRHIGDFSHWKEHDAYQAAFARRLA